VSTKSEKISNRSGGEEKGHNRMSMEKREEKKTSRDVGGIKEGRGRGSRIREERYALRR